MVIRQRGLTLIELMISLVLSLLIAAAIGSIYLGSSQSFRTGSGLAQLQEQGRYASLLVTPIVRQSGYRSDPALGGDPAAAFPPANRQFAVIGYEAIAPSGYPSFAPASVRPTTDVLAVAFQGQGSSASTADAPLRTCLGAPVYRQSIAVNIFYVTQPDSAGVSSLNCYSNVGALNAPLAAGTINNQPLLAGVSDLQIRYGIDARGDGSAISYYDAAQVESLRASPGGFGNPSLATNPWLAVAEVQIAYTVDSADAVEPLAAHSGRNLSAEGRLRGRFVTTIELRNRLHD